MIYIVKKLRCLLRTFSTYDGAIKYMDLQKDFWHDHCCKCEHDRGYDHSHYNHDAEYSIITFDANIDSRNDIYIITRKEIVYIGTALNFIERDIIKVKEKEDLEYNDGFVHEPVSDTYYICICRFGVCDTPDESTSYYIIKDDDMIDNEI